MRFAPATGCATFPEADLNATGTPSKGALPYGRVGGLVDGHMHWMTFEYFGGNFHCGRPWHAYGIASALPDCASIEGPGGVAATFQNFLNYGNPAQPHDTRGYPDLTAWKRDQPDLRGHVLALDPAGVDGRAAADGHERQREPRAVRAAGQRRRPSCDEMETVRRGLDDIRELQRYVDAQAGGPGKGFFQIVTDPYEARRVINAGKMAVVLEIEVSEPFGCRDINAPTCDRAKVDRELDDLYARGVRSALLLNKFDNPLTGVRFDSGLDRRADQRREPAQRRELLEREDLHRAAARQHDHASRSTRAWPGCWRRSGSATRVLPLYPPAAALQHARADRPRRARGRSDDGQAHDRQPGSHEPGGGRRDVEAARGARVLAA